MLKKKLIVVMTVHVQKYLVLVAVLIVANVKNLKNQITKRANVANAIANVIVNVIAKNVGVSFVVVFYVVVAVVKKKQKKK